MTSKLDFSPALQDQVILITGGSGGIGKETAHIFADNGANVAITYNNNAEATFAIQNQYPKHISVHKLNLADEESIKRVFREVISEWGRVDAVVNNAAAGSATIADYEPDAEKRDEAMFQINAVGALHVAKEALRLMEGRHSARPGKIINISSVGGGIAVFPGFLLSDGMSKAAVTHMTKQMAAENMDGNIHILALCPGATKTAMFERSTLTKMTDKEQSSFLYQLPRGRLIAAEEVALAIATLVASDTLSGLFHGAVIDASMGLGVRPGKMSEVKHAE